MKQTNYIIPIEESRQENLDQLSIDTAPAQPAANKNSARRVSITRLFY